ncbi:MAG: DUF998 domain-containing protein [Microbacterium sp.]
MKGFGARALRMLGARLDGASPRAALEDLALLVGAAFFVLGFVVALPAFWGRELAIVGVGSVGHFAAVSGAVVAGLSFFAGRFALREAPDWNPPDGFALVGERLRWWDLLAIGLAHAAVALLGWLGVATLLELCFQDAPVYSFPGALLVGVALALTAYVCFLSAAELSPPSLSLVLSVFLVVGAFGSMLTSNDKHWWRDNLSALGQSYMSSAPVFNLTLIIAGIIVATIARFATAWLPTGTHEQRRGRRIVRVGFVLIGILLALVGVFPVDLFFVVHNTVATGMAVIFAVVVIGLPWFVPEMPRVFVVLGWVYVAVIALLGVFFATGYYNLTAVELIAGVLILSWIVVFLRTGGVAHPVRVPEPETEASV